MINKQRRKFAISAPLIWTTPIIQSVVIPVHAQTSMNVIVDSGTSTVSPDDNAVGSGNSVVGDGNVAIGSDNSVNGGDGSNASFGDSTSTANGVGDTLEVDAVGTSASENEASGVNVNTAP